MASSATSSERARFAAKLTQADAIAEHYADFVGQEYDNAIISEYKYVAHTRCLSLSRLGLKESAGVPASLVPVGRCIVILRGTQAPETPKRR